jgi:uncharacterized protein YjeT (DUF2065 family)
MGDEFLVALGLVFVIEGLLWALFPGSAKRLAELALRVGVHELRLSGAAAIAIGVLIVWLVRG